MNNSPEWYRDEEFRQRVIRQAILLGFEASEEFMPSGLSSEKAQFVWRFNFEGHTRGNYSSLYTAALEYLRLMKVPNKIIGADIGPD